MGGKSVEVIQNTKIQKNRHLANVIIGANGGHSFLFGVAADVFLKQKWIDVKNNANICNYYEVDKCYISIK